MFINSKICFEIRDGEKVCLIPKDYIGEIPAWAATHWLVRAAIADGSIATPKGAADKELRRAEREAKKKAEAADIRPADEESAENEGAENESTDIAGKNE